MTIKDVAEYSGVSVSTVSRVLNHHPDVSDAVRARVMEAVEKLHYVPNNSARDLVRSQSDSIGLVVRGVGNLFFPSVIHAIEQAADRAGYTLVLHQIRSGEDELLAGASLARSRRLRGLVLLGGCFDYTPEQTAALESDVREGMIAEYLDKLLPEDWDRMDLAERRGFLRGDQFTGGNRVGTVQRTTVCAVEVWAECFGKDPSAIKRSDT